VQYHVCVSAKTRAAFGKGGRCYLVFKSCALAHAWVSVVVFCRVCVLVLTIDLFVVCIFDAFFFTFKSRIKRKNMEYACAQK
jgi:hypothetical protein